MTTDQFTNDRYFMNEAYKQALLALEEGEIPVGAVVVCRNQVVAKAYNQTEKLHDVTAHAEMLAITAAANFLHAKYLTTCTLYVTLEPCVMCAGALAWAQIGRLVYGASDHKKGYSLVPYRVLHPKTKVVQGLMAEESEVLLTEFFRKLRN
jgi:tRNA(adenine34) deaminase